MPIVPVTTRHLTRRRIILTATHRSTGSTADRSTDDGTVLATYTLSHRSTGRATQNPAQHSTSIDRKRAGADKEQRSNNQRFFHTIS
jgi:hypothetical protein